MCHVESHHRQNVKMGLALFAHLNLEDNIGNIYFKQ
jgi:hypothetical protein